MSSGSGWSSTWNSIAAGSSDAGDLLDQRGIVEVRPVRPDLPVAEVGHGDACEFDMPSRCFQHRILAEDKWPGVVGFDEPFAQILLTDHLLEGANLASGGGEASQLTSSPLLSGASGRLWISKDGRVRLELRSEKGDTQIYYDGHTLSMYDASSNTLYRYTPPKEDAGSAGGESGSSSSGGASGAGATEGPLGVAQPEIQRDQAHEAPSVAKIEEAIARLSKHTDVSGATPTDVAGQAAYTVRISPREGGSLLAGAELSWDAVHGVPLRAAVYSTESASPVLELAATSISYGPVEPSVFEFTPPANAKVEEVVLPKRGEHQGSSSQGGEHEHPNVTTHGSGPGTIAVLEGKAKTGSSQTPRCPKGCSR